MSRNVNKKILHVTIGCLFLSIVVLFVLSCITVAPEIKPHCELLFCFFGVIFVISLSTSLYVCLVRRRRHSAMD